MSTKETVSISVPGWLMPILGTIIAAMMLSTIAWAWGADSRIERGEEAFLVTQELQMDITGSDQEIALIKQELKYLREDMKEVLQLLKER